jgi:hypothetical protein
MTPTHPTPPAKVIATSVSPNLSVVVIVVGSLKVARLSTDVAKNASDQVEAPEVVNKTVSCGTRLIPTPHEEALPFGVEQEGWTACSAGIRFGAAKPPPKKVAMKKRTSKVNTPHQL